MTDKLTEIIKECSVRDWDGYGAEPLDMQSVEYVKAFLKLLPSNIVRPELSPSPWGYLTLEWESGLNVDICSFNGVGAISWGLYNKRVVTESNEPFNNTIPDKLLKILPRKTKAKFAGGNMGAC